jgi:hypothetical protein
MRRPVVVVMQRRTSLFALVLVHQKLVLRLVLRLPSPLLLVLMLLRRRDTLEASRL